MTFFSLTLLLLCSCAKGPGGTVGPSEYGMLEVRVRMVNQPLNKSAAQNEVRSISGVDAVAQTIAENLVVEISGGDLSPTQFKLKLDASRPTVIDTVKKVPVGEARKVVIWAVNKNGDKTHIDTLEERRVNIEKASVTQVSATLIPAAGSIYVHINSLGTEIKTVHASFTSRDGESIFQNSVERAAHTFLSIDNVPHELDGILRVSLVDTKGDTVKVATKEFIFNARGDNTIELQFIENNGMLGVDAVLYAPGVTAASYDFGKNMAPSTVTETGEIIITEIMFSASNDNYIELYNPKNEAVSFDTLTILVDDNTYNLTGVSIGAKGYYVIGRQTASYVNIVSNMTIASTGNWITVRRGKAGAIFDRVICGGANSAVGWPAGLSSSSKKSVELNRDKYDVIDNNFGKNWAVATAGIDGTNLTGTPGK